MPHLLPSTPFFISSKAVIQCVAALKRRPLPNSLSHDSVGTEDELTVRAESRKTLNSLRITAALLDPYVVSLDELVKWSYITEVPDGPGGLEPSLEGKVAQKCERCAQPFQIKRKDEADQCIYHWGRPYTTIVGGAKVAHLTHVTI